MQLSISGNESGNIVQHDEANDFMIANLFYNTLFFCF